MSRLVFLLEERSMKELLQGLLPRLFPGLNFLCIAHEGKQDLEKSIPRKLRAWKEPGVVFVVLRDNDSSDCHELKLHLRALCEKGQRPDTLVRIVCQELESWYFGDVGALARAFERPSLAHLDSKARYRDPDSIVQPSRALQEEIEEFQKISGARRMSAHLSTENRSHSYRVFLQGIARLHRSLVEQAED